MIEPERLAKAREWYDAAKKRRDHAVDKLDHEHMMSDAQATAYHMIADGMRDRMQVIEALFPEINSQR